jgi:hypothetical protein
MKFDASHITPLFFKLENLVSSKGVLDLSLKILLYYVPGGTKFKVNVF